MWYEGRIPMANGEYYYQAKVYETGSNYGINDGRISKLFIKKNDVCVFNYDRGDDVNHLDEDGYKVYDAILGIYA